MSASTVQDDNLDRPIWGAEIIGAIVNRNPRQAYYLLEKGELPARKVGRTWVSTRRQLLNHVIGDDQAAT